MRLPIECRYRTGEISLLLQSHAPGSFEVIDEILAHHGFASFDGGAVPDVSFVVDTKTHPIDVPDAARELAVHASGLSVLYLGDRRYLRHSDASAEINLSQGTVRASVPTRDDVPERVHTQNLLLIITFSIIILLQHRGRYALHAAALTHRSDEGMLIVGESDSGKSTMTMHLVREGWHYVSDDSILLRRNNDAVEATPLRRDFALDPDAAELFPEIMSHSKPLLTDAVKRKVQPDHIFPDMRLERCIPRFIVFPELVGAGSSRLQPLSGRDALLRLMRQASFITQDPMAATAQIHTLRELVRQSSSYLLQAANDIKRDGPRVSELLASVIRR